MKKRLLVYLLVLTAGVALAAEPDLPETWESGDVAGWNRYDPLSKRLDSMVNAGGYLQVKFKSQGRDFPQVHMVRADLTASTGQFAGQYWREAITNVSFKFLCETHVAADLRLYIANNTSSNWWYYRLSSPPVGVWTEYSVPMDYESGWRIAEGTSGQFKEDLQNAEWIGILIQRNKSTSVQKYGIDDFVLKGASRTRDGDDDGHSEWQEFIAGTDDGDRDSLFQVDISFTNTPAGRQRSVLKWQSAIDRSYTIKRTTNLALGFPETRKRLPGKPSKTWYEDDDSEDGKVYFYKIEVE